MPQCADGHVAMWPHPVASVPTGPLTDRLRFTVYLSNACVVACIWSCRRAVRHSPVQQRARTKNALYNGDSSDNFSCKLFLTLKNAKDKGDRRARSTLTRQKITQSIECGLQWGHSKVQNARDLHRSWRSLRSMLRSDEGKRKSTQREHRRRCCSSGTSCPLPCA